MRFHWQWLIMVCGLAGGFVGLGGCFVDAPPTETLGGVDASGSADAGGGTGGDDGDGQTATTQPGSGADGDDAPGDGGEADAPDPDGGPGDGEGTDAGDGVPDDGADQGDADAGSQGDDVGDEQGGDDGPGEDGLIDVTLSGCTIDFSGTIVVSFNGSLGVAAVGNGGGTLNGSFQFDLDGPDTFALSTQHRVDTDTVINMVDVGQGTWTNLDPMWPDVDAVGGTLDVEAWAPADGMATVHFDNVTLVNVGSGNVCTIDGTVEAYALI